MGGRRGNIFIVLSNKNRQMKWMSGALGLKTFERSKSQHCVCFCMQMCVCVCLFIQICDQRESQLEKHWHVLEPEKSVLFSYHLSKHVDTHTCSVEKRSTVCSRWLVWQQFWGMFLLYWNYCLFLFSFCVSDMYMSSASKIMVTWFFFCPCICRSLLSGFPFVSLDLHTVLPLI